MSPNRIITAVCGVAAAVGLVGTGAALAHASTPQTTAGTSSYSAVASADTLPAARQGSRDTPVTGNELSRVTAAVKAKEPSVTVTQVRRDPDGSYDVFGTRAGAPVMLQVSKDLKTVSAWGSPRDGRRGGGPGGCPGGPGAPGSGQSGSGQSGSGQSGSGSSGTGGQSGSTQQSPSSTTTL